MIQLQRNLEDVEDFVGRHLRCVDSADGDDYVILQTISVTMHVRQRHERQIKSPVAFRIAMLCHLKRPMRLVCHLSSHPHTAPTSLPPAANSEHRQ